VVAGAGSGKTLTVSAKAKYLVERKGIDTEKILLLSFTRKSANEMSDRITNKLRFINYIKKGGIINKRIWF